VQQPMPRAADDELGEHDRQRQVGALLVERLDVVDHRRDDRAVRRDDQLQGQVIAPRIPVAVEALGLLFIRADVQGKNRLSQRGRVCKCPETRKVELCDRNQGQVTQLLGALLWPRCPDPTASCPGDPERLRWGRS
jgi:hypothetical protein